jgi:hypothetical protein
VVPDLAHLEFIARAVTPPRRPRRFDARFFMADATRIGHMLETAESDELLACRWVTFAEARALDLPAITRAVLHEAEARIAGDGARPIPYFRVRHGKPEVIAL